MANRPRLETAELDRPHSDPDEAADGETEGGEHSPDLALQARAEDDPVPDERLGRRAWADALEELLRFGRRCRTDPHGPGDPLGKGDPGPEPIELGPGETPIDPDGILAFDPEARVEDPLRPGPVVRQEDETLRIAVEAPDREEAPPRPRADGHEIDDGPGREAISDRRRHPGRLVEGEVDRARGNELDRPTVDGDPNPSRVDPLAENRRSAVDGDPPGGDEGVDGPP